ncbi:uncharacterized protein LOC129319637 [Prosopis cineraria]|uniref:uncharacterized protein LOC129319637 n=1 Tax=Prosopis cineraria TaxID=364024 RepID=UPI00240F8F67|nr:uncharacterized protein LOC129319637 [Prosopis cineraria]
MVHASCTAVYGTERPSYFSGHLCAMADTALAGTEENLYTSSTHSELLLFGAVGAISNRPGRKVPSDNNLFTFLLCSPCSLEADQPKLYPPLRSIIIEVSVLLRSPARKLRSNPWPPCRMTSSNNSKWGKCTGDSIGYGRISGSKDNNSNGNGNNAPKGSSSSKGKNWNQIGDQIGYGKKRPPPPRK